MKKLGVYLLSAAMFLSVIFGGNAGISVYADTQEMQDGMVTLSVGTTDTTGMEIGDEVTININVSQQMSDSKPMSVSKITGIFSYDEEVFEEIKIGNIEPADGLDKGYSNGRLTFTSNSTNNNPTTVSGTVASVTLKVKKATDTTTFSYKEIEISAADTTYQNGKDEVEVTNSKKDSRTFEFDMATTATVHDKAILTVPVKIEQNTGFSALGITVEYGSGLIYKSVDLSSEMKAYVDCKEYSNVSTGKLTIAIAALKDIKLVGTDLLYLNFEATPDSLDITADIKVTVTQVENQSLVSMNGANKSKTCTVSFEEELKLGDVNGDGNINLIDASYVLQSYNGVRDLTSDQIERADVNGSDTVTLVDAFRIMKYYNGAIKSF